MNDEHVDSEQATAGAGTPFVFVEDTVQYIVSCWFHLF